MPPWIIGPCSLLALGLLACQPRVAPRAAPAARAAPVDGARGSMVPLCLAVAEGKEVPVEALQRHPLVKKMAIGMAPQVTFTPEEMARAAAAPRPDPRFSWDRLRRNARFVRGFLAEVQGREQALVLEGLRRASELATVRVDSLSVAFHLVCGSAWDAYVLLFEKPELFFDLGWQADREPAEALRDFKAILAHELWHLVFLEQQRRWPRPYRKAEDPAALFLYEMLNEGVGHYYSMHHRLYPSPSWPDFGERVRKVFALLEKGYPAYLTARDPADRRERLWRSHAGVPFWEKWGAVPGALIVYRLEQKLGRPRLARLIAEEPMSFILAYEDEARAGDPAWPALPAALVADTRRLLESHRRAAIRHLLDRPAQPPR